MVKRWRIPTTLTNIWSFLGVANYYRRFVESFSSITAPLTKLTHKKAKVLWSDACEGSFKNMKDKLTTASVLTMLEGTNGFMVYYDASRVGLGCLLMHRDKVVAYAST